MKFEFTVGDWSKDGHNQSDTFIFETDATLEQIRAAYKDLNENLDFNNWFRKYEQSSISSSQYEEFKDFAPEIAEKYMKPVINYKTNEPTGDFGFIDGGPDEYVSMWAELIEKTDPSIKLKLINEGLPVIHGGGYGLYWG